MRRQALSFLMVVLISACGGTQDPPTSGTTPPGPTSDSKAKQSPEAALVDKLAKLEFSKLGHPVIRWDSIATVKAPKDKPHRLLVVLVEYQDVKFERFRGKKNQGELLAKHYQEQLFDESYSKRDTLSHYYLEQSAGQYHLTGKVLPPVTLSKTRRHYGSPNRPAGGNWRNDTESEGMVEEALQLMAQKHTGLPWSDYDHFDPIDYDKDGITDEPDGYLDHFVLVFAGGGQASCQLLNNIGDVLTPNVDNKALSKLNKRQRECADRMWPHRDAVRRREGEGPKIAGTMHRRGGVPLTDSLWAYDYNMQSEYTAAATFIHEFGHSIGLPDVYSRTSSNSTGLWEVMSSTADPSPQNMSAWSRIQLGWLKPKVIVPPKFGGEATQSVELKRLDDNKRAGDAAVMVVLPPKKKVIELVPPLKGKTAMYSGQGNELNRSIELEFSLAGAKKATLSMAAWWEIEAAWDFAYVEASKDGGKTWQRLVPTDRRHMPAKHGHDGKNTLPGFTGISGDLDGDGKNESNPKCDPKREVKQGEDSAGEKNPCLDPTWATVSFALDPVLNDSTPVKVRLRYYTDGAAVMRGIMVDDLTITTFQGGEGVAKAERFESDDWKKASPFKWRIDGFSPSTGRHEFFVPHFYVLEYRDPYKSQGYDKGLSDPSYAFYYDTTSKQMMAMASRPRPGVVAWYSDGAYAWSENDPAINGPGKGYLLALDALPEEIQIPGLQDLYQGKAGSFATHYEVKSKTAQERLQTAYQKTVCYVRSHKYLPAKGTKCPRKYVKGPAQKLRIGGKQAMYTYEVGNEYLPENRGRFKKIGELFDSKVRKGQRSWRMRDRTLRYLHTFDAPFSSETFKRARVFFKVVGNQLVEAGAQDLAPQAKFNDSEPSRWLNPKLPFGGTALPKNGLSFEVKSVGDTATLDVSFQP